MIALLGSILSFNAMAQGTVLQPGNASTVKVSSERLKRIDQLLQGQIDSGLIKGVVGFVAREGKVVYYKAFGVDDADKKTPLKPNAIFRIASQTKAITSVAVMILFEEGKLLLDDPVVKYLPAFAHQQVIDQFNHRSLFGQFAQVGNFVHRCTGRRHLQQAQGTLHVLGTRKRPYRPGRVD